MGAAHSCLRALDSGLFAGTTWIPDSNLKWIPDPLSCTPYSKAQDSGFHKQNFLGFQNPDFLTWGEIGEHF